MKKKHKLAVIPPKPKMPKPVLKAGVIYSGDNGQLICVHCAGRSALYSGRDLSGHKVTPNTHEDADDWMRVMGVEMKCEGGCTTHKPSPGVTYSEEAARAMFASDSFLDAASVATAIES